MAKTKRRPSWRAALICVLMFVLVLALVPHFVYAEDEYWDEGYSNGAAYGDPHVSSFSGGWLLGVDVSEWNGVIDWEAVAAGGIDYAILRCGVTYGSYGECDVDEQFYYNASECERLGIPYGVYYYSGAENYDEAVAEAWYVLSVIDGCSLFLPVYIDLEVSYMGSPEWADTLTEISQGFCGTIAAAGYRPGVYASVSWWAWLLTDPCFDEWSKWVAAYDSYCDYDDADIWQYTDDGEAYGIDWPVDLNILYL